MDIPVLMVMEAQPYAYEKEQNGQQYRELLFHEDDILR